MENLINSFNNDLIKTLKNFIGNDTTYTEDLYKKGKYLLGPRFRGVFSADNQPTVKNNQMYIANLDNSNESGSHWIAVYKSNDILYIYDSFGRDIKSIIGGSLKMKYIGTDTDAEQKDNENNCGLRSIVALILFDTFNPSLISKYL